MSRTSLLLIVVSLISNKTFLSMVVYITGILFPAIGLTGSILFLSLFPLICKIILVKLLQLRCRLTLLMYKTVHFGLKLDDGWNTTNVKVSPWSLAILRNLARIHLSFGIFFSLAEGTQSFHKIRSRHGWCPMYIHGFSQTVHAIHFFDLVWVT